MNGFDAEKLAKHGEVWLLNEEPFFVSVNDGCIVAKHIHDGHERSLASNLPARRFLSADDTRMFASWSGEVVGSWESTQRVWGALVVEAPPPVKCSACAVRKRSGFEGLCPACANERTRKELAADGTGRVASSCDPYGIAPCPTCRLAKPPPLTLDSTVREVQEALGGIEGLEVRPAEGTWTVGGSTLGSVRPGLEDLAKSISAPWEASGLVMGQDAHDHKVVTRRLSVLAPTALEALVALGNAVRET